MRNKDQVNTMMKLSEEVNALNFKLQQLLRMLDDSPSTIDQVKNITKTLNTKVSGLNKDATTYEAPVVDEVKQSTPSYKEQGVDRTVMKQKEVIKRTTKPPVLKPPVKKPVKPPVKNKKITKPNKPLSKANKPLGSSKNAG